MSFWDSIKQDCDEIAEAFHRDKLAERTWECDPLLIVDDVGVIAFSGNVSVDVTPHADGTADLIAQVDVEGWRPSLKNAKVAAYTPPASRYRLHCRDGIMCRGSDEEGTAFEWFINGAAEAKIVEGGSGLLRSYPRHPKQF